MNFYLVNEMFHQTFINYEWIAFKSLLHMILLCFRYENKCFKIELSKKTRKSFMGDRENDSNNMWIYAILLFGRCNKFNSVRMNLRKKQRLIMFSFFVFQGPPQQGPLKFTIADTLERIKEEFNFLQQQYHT